MNGPTINRRQAGALLLAGAAAPSLHALPASGRSHVPWSRNASIYEVNIRQFTREGTLRAFEAQLPRIARLNVGIVWLMPLQPIGQLKRKGTLGSYYAVSDYTAVNSEFGTLDDVKRVVAKAHALGLKVILDWVANHTAWDHPWITQHPDWYQKNAQGELTGYTFSPAEGKVEVWEDVVGLDYRQSALWPAMTDAMLFWLREVGVDGFRCDVAGLVPTPFWEQLRAQLDAVKPVFMLAESDKPELHQKAFDMGYDWKLYDTLKQIAKGQADASTLRAWWARRQSLYPADAIGMNFTGNHDSNSWDGSDLEFYGSAAAIKAMTVLTTTLPGMPLVYGGQESIFDKRLQFFEKDPIAWKNYELAPHLARLLWLKRRHPALAIAGAGGEGGTMDFVPLDNDAVVSYVRRQGARSVGVTVNLSGRVQNCASPSSPRRLTLAPWAWQIQQS